MQTTIAPAQAPAARLDVYTPIHKALRAQMADALVALGAIDVADDGARSRALDRVEALLAVLRKHLQHENDFLHTAIEARMPGGAMHTARDHVDHLETIANLEDECRALRDGRAEHRGALALGLYRHLGAFVAENLEHMLVEERENNARLQATHSDAELARVHDALLASIPPDELMRSLRWLVVALTPGELLRLFEGLRAAAPAPAFAAALDVARSHMDAARYAPLARALGLAPVPGLVTV